MENRTIFCIILGIIGLLLLINFSLDYKQDKIQTYCLIGSSILTIVAFIFGLVTKI